MLPKLILVFFAATIAAPSASLRDGSPGQPDASVSDPVHCAPAAPAALGAPPGACQIDDADFATGNGGCQDLASGLVWSQYTGSNPYPLAIMQWWDLVAYCDNLDEGGFTDWFLPSREQMAEVAFNGAFGHLEGSWGAGIWMPSSTERNHNKIYNCQLTNGVIGTDFKSSYRTSICARFPIPLGPAVDGISPGSINAGQTIAAVTITGAGFVPGATLTFVSGTGPGPVAVGATVGGGGTTLTATVSVSQGGPPGIREWNVRVTNPDGGSGELVDGFLVIK